MPGPWTFSMTFDDLLEHRPALKEKYRVFLDAVNSGGHVPGRVLDLCRSRIEQIHGIAGGSSIVKSDLDEGELAALMLAEKIPFAHHQVEDGEVERVKAVYGDAGCVQLLTALSFFDVTARLQLTFAEVP